MKASPADNLRDQSDDDPWRTLYRIGGTSAIAAALFAVLQAVIEATGLMTVGSPPQTIEGWFTLLQTNRLLGLTELTMFQIPAFVLTIPMYLALYFVLRRTGQSLAMIGTALSLVGVAVYLATNTVFSMLSLSDQYAAATTDAQRAAFLAAGQAMSAISVTSVDVGISLLSAAGLIVSVVMLRSLVFNRLVGYVGILAAGTEFAYYVSLTLLSLGIILLEAAGVFFVLWLLLIGLGLRRLGASLGH